MYDKELWLIQRKMTWINTKLLLMNLFVAVNIALFILIKKTIFQIASFLLVSLFSLVVWYKWNRNIESLI